MTAAGAQHMQRPPARPAPGAGRAQARPGRINSSSVAIALFVAATLAMLTGLGGHAANVAFAGAAALTGAVLLSRSPVTYSTFCLWLWFLTPFVRRVFDWRHGWNPTNPALLAPLLVSGLSVLTLVRYWRELRGRLFAPYLLILCALAYGYMVGLLNAGLIPATYALLTWLAPLAFGLHLALSWRRYPELGVAIRTTFAIAVPVLALYGIYQFVRIPPWDAAWMINSDLRSIGDPLPFLVRVFGTLNTPGPFAACLLAGMLILIGAKGFMRYPAIALALVALLLARTRAVWVAFLLGLVVQQLSLPVVRLPRRLITLTVVAILALPLTAIPTFRSTIVNRMSTLKNISSDNSFIKRVQFSQENAGELVQMAEGNGLGSTGGAVKLMSSTQVGVRSLDNGFLELYYLLGWAGGTMFLLGIAALIYQSLRFAESRRDPFASAVRATGIAIVSMLPIGDVFTGSTGTLVWAMTGLGIGAHAYHLTTGLALRSRALRESLANRASQLPVAGRLAASTLAPTRAGL